MNRLPVNVTIILVDNLEPEPFVWTTSAPEVLAKASRGTTYLNKTLLNDAATRAHLRPSSAGPQHQAVRSATRPQRVAALRQFGV